MIDDRTLTALGSFQFQSTLMSFSNCPLKVGEPAERSMWAIRTHSYREQQGLTSISDGVMALKLIHLSGEHHNIIQSKLQSILRERPSKRETKQLTG